MGYVTFTRRRSRSSLCHFNWAVPWCTPTACAEYVSSCNVQHGGRNLISTQRPSYCRRRFGGPVLLPSSLEQQLLNQFKMDLQVRRWFACGILVRASMMMRVESWTEGVRGKNLGLLMTAKARRHVQSNLVDIYISCFMLLFLVLI